MEMYKLSNKQLDKMIKISNKNMVDIKYKKYHPYYYNVLCLISEVKEYRKSQNMFLEELEKAKANIVPVVDKKTTERDKLVFQSAIDMFKSLIKGEI